MSTGINNNLSGCTDFGTHVEMDAATGELTITASDGSTSSVDVDAFAAGNGNGTTARQSTAGSSTPPDPPSRLRSVDQDGVAAEVESYATQNRGSSYRRSTRASGNSGANASNGAPGSNWAKKLDDLYAELENNPDMSAEDMQKLQMKMQQAMQMFQLFTQMMTAMYEAKKDAGRQIRY